MNYKHDSMTVSRNISDKMTEIRSDSLTWVISSFPMLGPKIAETVCLRIVNGVIISNNIWKKIFFIHL